MYFIIKGKGSYSNDYKKPEEKKKKEHNKMYATVPIEADPNHRELKKIGKEVLKMKASGESKERMDRELGSEALKYTKFANK